MAVSKFQSFETEIISRSQIRNAEYNPRIMDEKAKKRLKRSIRQNGLVSALTWNRRTGNLVGGHQRLEQLDALEKSGDYELTVCVIDVDEREEAKINIQLNNPDMQGYYDGDKLSQMMADFDLSLDDAGFSLEGAEFLFDGDERFTALFNTPEAETEKGKLKAIKEDRAKMKDRLGKENKIDFFLTIVFENGEERAAFQKEIHVPLSEIYVTADQVRRLRGASSGV